MLPEMIVYVMFGIDAQHPHGMRLAKFNTLTECTNMMMNAEVIAYIQKNNIRVECRAVKE